MLSFMRKNRQFLAKVLFLFFGLSFAQSIIAAGDESKKAKLKTDAYSRAAFFHLPSLSAQEQAEIEALNKIKEENNKLINENKGKPFATILSIPPVGKVESLRMIYDLFAVADLEDPKTKKTLLSDNVFGDLEVLCGNSRDHKNKHLFSVINNLRTPFGKAVLQGFFTQKYESVDLHTKEIERRQAIVKCLLKDEELFNSLDKCLKEVAKNTANLIWFYKSLDSMMSDFLGKIYYGNRLGINFSSMNESSIPLNFSARWYLIEPVLPLILMSPLLYGLGFLQFSRTDHPHIAAAACMAFLFVFSLIIQSIQQAILGFPTYKAIKACERHINGKMFGLSDVVNQMQNVDSLIESDSTLSTLIPNLKWLDANQSSGESVEEFNKLFDDLKSGTFKVESSFFSNKGKILAAFKKMQRLGAEMIGSLKVLGEIDAYMSIAKLYKKFENNPNVKYCFPEFVKADQPYINIQKFWHPFLDPKKAVPNSIELGTPELGHNVILTGPNAAGKSSSLKGIIISIILAQTLGIAPASKMIFTPFAKINSHLNISDDEGRESLYQAEKNRVKGFLNELKQLGKGEFEFAILDEMFSSTNPEEGQSAAYAIAKSLAKVPNCMCMYATHFKKLTELEVDTNGWYKNYKVYVDMQPDGTFKCPYKIVPGISNQNIAIAMLQHEFDADIVDEAYDVLSQIKEDTSDIIGFEQNKTDRPVVDAALNDAAANA